MYSELHSQGGFGEEEEEISQEEQQAQQLAMALVDDCIPPLTRTLMALESDLPLQRLMHIRPCIQLLEEEESTEVIVEVLDKVLPSLKTDKEFMVRHTIAEQLPAIGEIITTRTKADPSFAQVGTQQFENILAIFSDILRDESGAVRDIAVTALVAFVEFLPHDQKEKVIAMVKALLMDPEEESRVIGISLCHLLAVYFGETLCTEALIPELTRLSEDGVFRVRKAVAMSLSNICGVVGTEKSEKVLLPLFLELSEDDIWGVRKGCAESLFALSEVLSRTARKDTLIPLFHRFSEDVSIWVKNAAHQQLGPFLSTLTNEDISEDLLKNFTSMAFSSQLVSTEDEGCSFCAFSFPAVVLTVGKDRWGELQDAYQHLIRNIQWEIRRCMSHSLHEIAKILGTELSEQHLLPTLELFMKDLDEVKVGVITHIADFLEVLSPACRQKYFYLLEELEVEDSTSPWRFRMLIAEQLGRLIELFPPENATSGMCQLTLSLARDNVSMVRDAAHSSVGVLIMKLREIGAGISDSGLVVADVKEGANSSGNKIDGDDDRKESSEKQNEEGKKETDGEVEATETGGGEGGEGEGEGEAGAEAGQKEGGSRDDSDDSDENTDVDMVVSALYQLLNEVNYSSRQIYVSICGHLAHQIPIEMFEEHFLIGLLNLAFDKVPNVRLTLARVLTSSIAHHDTLKSHPGVVETIEKMKEDRDRDVVYYASGLDKSSRDEARDVREREERAERASNALAQDIALAQVLNSDERRGSVTMDCSEEDVAEAMGHMAVSDVGPSPLKTVRSGLDDDDDDEDGDENGDGDDAIVVGTEGDEVESELVGMSAASVLASPVGGDKVVVEAPTTTTNLIVPDDEACHDGGEGSGDGSIEQ